MPLGGGLRRLGATYLLIARQRLELAALDVEEELLRAALLVAGMLACVALACLALAAAAATIVVVWWDTHRLAALLGVTLFFGLAVVMPVLGHATWHLYRRVVEPDPSPRPEYHPQPKGRRYAADFPSSLFVPLSRNDEP